MERENELVGNSELVGVLNIWEWSKQVGRWLSLLVGTWKSEHDIKSAWVDTCGSSHSARVECIVFMQVLIISALHASL